MANIHVALFGKNILGDAFDGQPANGQHAARLSDIDQCTVAFTAQTEITELNYVIVAFLNAIKIAKYK